MVQRTRDSSGTEIRRHGGSPARTAPDSLEQPDGDRLLMPIPMVKRYPHGLGGCGAKAAIAASGLTPLDYPLSVMR
jgi:hypothetical protein